MRMATVINHQENPMADDTASIPVDAPASAGLAPTPDTPAAAPLDAAIDAGTQPPEDDGEEVDFEGEKYRVPKKMREALTRASDHEAQAREVAEQRRTLEAERAQWSGHSKAAEEHIDRVATLKLIDSHLARFPQTPQQWDAFEQQDAAAAASAFRQYQQIQAQRGQLAQQVTGYQQAQQQQQQQAIAQRAQASVAVLKQHIPDFSEKTLSDIEAFAVKEFGFKPEQIRAVVDPGPWLLAHRLMTMGGGVKDKIAEAVAAPLPTAAKPVTKVGANGGGGQRDPAKMTDSEFADWRRRQIAQRNK